MKDKRSFSVADVQNVDGCPTKFRKGRYKSVSPVGAAKKAFSGLCNVKNIKGTCTFIITMRETTRGSNNKEFTYKLHRKKLPQPLVMFEGTDKEFTRMYTSEAEAADKIVRCKSGRRRTRGRMSRKSKRSKKTKKPKSMRKKHSPMNKKNTSNVSMKRTNNKKNTSNVSMKRTNNKKNANNVSMKNNRKNMRN